MQPCSTCIRLKFVIKYFFKISISCILINADIKRSAPPIGASGILVIEDVASIISDGPAIAGRPGDPNIYFLSLLVPAYKPNHAAPAPTTIDTKPDCSKVGVGKFINHIVTLYNRYM